MSNYFTDAFSLTTTTLQGLPGISPPLLLQQCIPVVYFPSNFQFLHSKLSELDHLHQTLCYLQLYNQENFITDFYNYLSRNVSVIVSSLNSESLQLFILHLMPYFNNSLTVFDAILTSFDDIVKYLNHDEIIRVFSPLLQGLYDQTSLSPQHKAQILHRPFLNTLIHRFGLAHFLDRYVSHVIEAVINPAGVHSKKEDKRDFASKDDQFHVTKEEQSMTTRQTKQQLSLLLDIEPEYSSEEEADDVIGETYTSLLAQTPLQTPKQLESEERTISGCSVEDVISMEPIAVTSPPQLEAVVDVEDDTLMQNDQLLPYQPSPDITASNDVFNLVTKFVINFFCYPIYCRYHLMLHQILHQNKLH